MTMLTNTITFFILSYLIAMIPCQANDNDHLNYLRLCEERARKYIHDVIAAEKQPAAFSKALKTIRDAIEQDNIILDDDGEEDIHEFRSKIYAYIYLELRQNELLSATMRTTFLDILGEGLVNDNTMWQKQHIVKHLSKYLWMEDKKCISKKFIKNLEKAAQDKDLLDKNMVLTLGFAQAPSIKKILKKYSDFESFSTVNSSPGWGAVLIRAWRGEAKYIERMKSLAENATADYRCRSLFEDMSIVHQEACVKYLYEYLKSDSRLPPLRSCDSGNLMGGYAACVLAKMLEGFPECKEPYFYKTEELEPYRLWMKEQKAYKFKKRIPL